MTSVSVSLTGSNERPRPLTSAQRGLWVSQRRHPEAPLQNMAQLCRIGLGPDGEPVDVERLSSSFDAVVRANDALRARFFESNGRASMRLVDSVTPTEVLDLAAAEASAWAHQRIQHSFDLANEVYDSVVLRHEDGTVSWYLNLHHLVTDATATALIVAETAAIYGGADPNVTTFVDAARDGKSDTTNDRRTELARAHWADRETPSPVAGLYQPVRRPTPRSERLPVTLPEDLRSLIDERLGADYRMLTPDLGWTTLLLTATAVLVHRLTGSPTVSVGVPVHNRDASTRDVIGPVMEVYPVDIDVAQDDSYRTLQRRAGRALLDTLKHARPDANQPGDSQAIVNVIPRGSHTEFAGRSISTEWIHPGASDPQHLLRVQLTSFGDDGLAVHLDVNEAGADADHRRRAPGHFVDVLRALVTDPDLPISASPLVADEEASLLTAWGAGDVVAQPASIVARLREQLMANDAVVLEDLQRAGTQTWTGPELWSWTTAIGSWLESEGVRPGDRVGLEMGRCADAVAAMIACLRAGFSYVPIDPDQPADRRAWLADTAACVHVIRSIPDDLARDTGPSETDAGSAIPADDAEAYLLFTSGSTGMPKGVPITHEGLSRYLDFAVSNYIDADRPPVIGLMSPLTFDLTVTSLYSAFLSGGRLVVIRPSGTPGLQTVASRTDITWLKATPSHLEVLARLAPDDHSLRTLVVGGEAFTMRLARRLDRTFEGVRMFNEYGPTEAVVGCMIHEVTQADLASDEADVPIGRPAPNVTLRIVDSMGQPVPIGVAGELAISSPGLTAGYLNAPEGSRDPFVELDGERSYLSGDLVRLLDHDTAVYHGRIDEQIKVGGIRLEPVEVEQALALHPSIERAAVRLWAPTERHDVFNCVRCGLPDNVPAVTFDDDGVCSSCHDYDAIKDQAQVWFRDQDDLRAELAWAQKSRTGDYDAVALLSGGKDSTYMVFKLVELGFKVFALTLDNGFISDGAKDNVRESVKQLGIGHAFMTSDDMNEIFRASLDRFSNVCHGCYKALYTLATHQADELGAPLIVTGLSRGQLFETRLVPQQFESGRFDPDAIDRAVVEARKAYHRLDDPFNRLLDNDLFAEDDIFDRIRYIDFYRYLDVELSEMYRFLNDDAPWVRPDDTGRSTNCLVNAAGIHTHLTEQGYHNYAEPYAWDVRLGHKNRQEAMDELDDQLDLDEVAEMLDEIDYAPRRREVLSAWYEVVPGAEPPGPDQLRTFLADTLAAHQIPAAFMAVDELPHTTNGKLDLEALPAPDRVHRSGPAMHVTPTTALEVAIVDVWERVLGVEPIGIDDDFFDLGGDSLAALEMVIAVSDAIGATVREEYVFAHTTPRALAAAISAADSDDDLGAPERTADDIAPPLSNAEQGLLFEVQNRPDRTAYNVGRHYIIDGDVDGEGLRSAFETVVRRHPSLRWTFSEPRKHLVPSAALDFEIGDGPKTEAEVRAEMAALHDTPFDVEVGPLLRVRLDQLDDGRTSVGVLAHHLSADDQSFALIWNEVDQAYQGQALAAPSVDPGGHGVWQAARDHTASREFWADQWTEPANTSVNLWHDEASVAAGGGYRSIPSALSATELIGGPGSTPVATALGALALVVDRYQAIESDASETKRVGIGITASVRDHAAVESSIGYFINSIPVVVDWGPDATLSDVGQRAGQQLVSSFPHRTVPYTTVLTDARAAGRPLPAISILLAYEDLAPTSLGGSAATYDILSNDAAVVDATFFVQRRGDHIELGLEYRNAAVGEQAEQLLIDLDAMLTAMVRQGDERPNAVGLPSEASSELTGPALERTTSVVPSIATHLETGGDAPAVRCGDDRLSWAELAARSADIRGALSGASIQPGQRVIVAVERSTDLVAAMVAVITHGATYVPVDPSYPDDRILRMLGVAEASLILSDDPDRWRSYGTPVVGLADVETNASHQAVAATEGDDPVYVIFTSGSTGEPRGVEVTHSQLSASTAARFVHYDRHPGSFLMVSSAGFDSSIAGLFWTLVAGGELVLPTERQAHDPDALLDLLTKAATHTLMVPTLYGAVLERGAASEDWPDVIVVAGEACPPALVARHHELRSTTALVNEYGPTEATVWATVHNCDSHDGEGSVVPIGQPIAGSSSLVVDADGRLVPAGVPGELAIAGPGVTNGYLNDPAATSQKFFDTDQGSVYRTGDLVVVADGIAGRHIRFLGRIDDQLNVGGARVEPAEIERVLTQHPAVNAAIVVAVDARPTDELLSALSPADAKAVLAASSANDEPVEALRRELQKRSSRRRRLVAHLEMANPTDLNGSMIDELRTAARSSLASTSQPAAYVAHEQLARTAHGKLDRARALGLAIPNPSTTTARPSRTDSSVDSDETTQMVLELFATELDQPIGPDDDFFEAGADSLAALTVAAGIEQRFGCNFPVTKLIDASTARLVARELASAGHASSTDRSPTTGSSLPSGELLVPMRSGTDHSRPAVVLIAPGTGHLMGYQPLVETLDDELDIFGFPLPGGDGKGEILRSVPDVAAAMLADWHLLADRRVLMIGGSSGGLIAWEMAVALEAAGTPVESLLLQDTLHPQAWRDNPPPQGIDWYRHLLTEQGAMGTAREVGLQIGRRINYELAKRRGGGEVSTAPATERSPQVLSNQLVSATNEMTMGYYPTGLAGPVRFFAASDTDLAVTVERWEPLAADLRVDHLEGDHSGPDSIGSAHRVAIAARLVEEEIQQIEKTRS